MNLLLFKKQINKINKKKTVRSSILRSSDIASNKIKKMLSTKQKMICQRFKEIYLNAFSTLLKIKIK